MSDPTKPEDDPLLDEEEEEEEEEEQGVAKKSCNVVFLGHVGLSCHSVALVLLFDFNFFPRSRKIYNKWTYLKRMRLS